MRHLLDVNVLIALMDANHAFHVSSHNWWRKESPQWASCPLTQNGVIRIMASAGYRLSNPVTVAEMAAQLDAFIGATDHEFWPDTISSLDTQTFDHSRILSSKYLTDLYLLALAVENDGKFVTFDQGVPMAAVRGAKSERLVVL
jgi:toxin-antitoxin system PIN domain toxin